MNLTLALEQLMTHPDAAGQLATEIRARIAGPLLDQADAAGQHAAQVVDRLAPRLGAQPEDVGATDIPSWLSLLVADAMAGFLTGQASTCRHAPRRERPQLVIAAACKPGLIVCGACAHQLVAGPGGGTADRTCDGCGRVCSGLDDDGISPGVIRYGPLVFTFGVCSDCLPTTTVERTVPPADKPRRGGRGRGRGAGR